VSLYAVRNNPAIPHKGTLAMAAANRAARILGVALLLLASCQSHDRDAVDQRDARQALVTFLTTADALGRDEVTFSRLAETRAARPDVRSFATALIAGQTPLNDQIEALASSRQVTLPTDMDARHAVLYQQLQSQNERAFDQAYLGSQMQDRTMLIQAYQDQADTGTDPQVRDFARQHLPALMEGLRTAHTLAEGL
jgi:putative membrane protein